MWCYTSKVRGVCSVTMPKRSYSNSGLADDEQQKYQLETTFLKACKANKLSTVHRIFRRVKPFIRLCGVLDAAHRGNAKVVKLLAAEAPEDECPSVNPGTFEQALRLAILYKHRATIEELLKHRVQFNYQSSEAAGEVGDIEFLQWLVARGMRICSFTFEAACAHGHLGMIQYLIEKNLRAVKDGIETAATVATRTRSIEVLDLIELYFDWDARRKALTTAVRHNYQDLVERFIRPNLPGSNAVYYACFNGNQEILDILLANGGESEFQSGLVGATFGGELEFVKQMINLGAEVDHNIFRFAGNHGHMHIMKYFLDEELIDRHYINGAHYYCPLNASWAHFLYNYGFTSNFEDFHKSEHWKKTMLFKQRGFARVVVERAGVLYPVFHPVLDLQDLIELWHISRSRPPGQEIRFLAGTRDIEHYVEWRVVTQCNLRQTILPEECSQLIMQFL